MKAVVATDHGQLELNYMWLPTFLGMNSILKKEIETDLRAKLEGKELTEDVVNYAHLLVVQLLEKKFPNIKGLRDHLDSLKFIYYA